MNMVEGLSSHIFGQLTATIIDSWILDPSCGAPVAELQLFFILCINFQNTRSSVILESFVHEQNMRNKARLILLIWQSLWLYRGIIHAREADDRQNYLFANDPDAANLIQEYKIDLGNIDEYLESSGQEMPEEEIHRIPSFLTSNYEFDRVVNFYSPWCAHCQKFKTRYIDVAKKFAEGRNEQLKSIEFHAVSCSSHHWLCKASAIQGYPIVRLYKKGSVDFQEAKRFSPSAVALAYGVKLKREYDAESQEFVDEELRHYDEDVYDVLGAAMDAYRRTKKDVFHDATVSLLFALQFDVNVEESAGEGPDRQARIDTFSEWIDMLQWTLPSSWKLNTLINHIRLNNKFDKMTNDDIAKSVENNKEVVLNDPNVLWTNSCQRRSRKSEGYTCGIWALLHIISIGVAEQHHHVIGDTSSVTTEMAAVIIHDYINSFLGCKICKINFNKLYKKSCGKHERGCKRFAKDKHKGRRVDPRKNPNLDYWRDFSLWMWELHNSINLEVLRERKKIDGEEPSSEEIQSAIYPSVKACPNCRIRNGQWDKDAVYNYLKSVYWPEGVHNFKYVVLKSKKEDLKIRKPRQSLSQERRWQILGILLTLMFTIASQYYKNNKKKAEKMKRSHSSKRKKTSTSKKAIRPVSTGTSRTSARLRTNRFI